MNELLFKLFLVNLVLCACFVLTTIWTSMTAPQSELLPRLIGTTFVLGFASALGFVSRLLRALYEMYLTKEY